MNKDKSYLARVSTDPTKTLLVGKPLQLAIFGPKPYKNPTISQTFRQNHTQTLQKPYYLPILANFT